MCIRENNDQYGLPNDSNLFRRDVLRNEIRLESFKTRIHISSEIAIDKSGGMAMMLTNLTQMRNDWFILTKDNVGAIQSH